VTRPGAPTTATLANVSKASLPDDGLSTIFVGEAVVALRLRRVDVKAGAEWPGSAPHSSTAAIRRHQPADSSKQTSKRAKTGG